MSFGKITREPRGSVDQKHFFEDIVGEGIIENRLFPMGPIIYQDGERILYGEEAFGRIK